MSDMYTAFWRQVDIQCIPVTLGKDQWSKKYPSQVIQLLLSSYSTFFVEFFVLYLVFLYSATLYLYPTTFQMQLLHFFPQRVTLQTPNLSQPINDDVI